MATPPIQHPSLSDCTNGRLSIEIENTQNTDSIRGTLMKLRESKRRARPQGQSELFKQQIHVLEAPEFLKPKVGY